MLLFSLILAWRREGNLVCLDLRSGGYNSLISRSLLPNYGTLLVPSRTL